MEGGGGALTLQPQTPHPQWKWPLKVPYCWKLVQDHLNRYLEWFQSYILKNTKRSYTFLLVVSFEIFGTANTYVQLFTQRPSSCHIKESQWQGWLPPPNAPNAPNASDLIWHCPTPLVEVNQSLLALSIDNHAMSQSFQNWPPGGGYKGSFFLIWNNFSPFI